MAKITVATNLSMTGILKYLISKHEVKKSGKEFKLPDIQGYIRRGALPAYLGGLIITKTENEYNKLYNLVGEDPLY